MDAKHWKIFPFVLSIALVGCGAEQEAREPPPVEDTVFGDMVGAKERARSAVDQAMQERPNQLEQMERGETEQ